MYEFGSHDRLSYFFLGLNFEKNKTKIEYLSLFIFLFQEKAKNVERVQKSDQAKRKNTFFFGPFNGFMELRKT